jgi:hypothetical protein
MFPTFSGSGQKRSKTKPCCECTTRKDFEI